MLHSVGKRACIKNKLTLGVELIQEANQNGARLAKSCEELNSSVRTYERWVSAGGVQEDQRPHVQRIGKKEGFVDLSARPVDDQIELNSV